MRISDWSSDVCSSDLLANVVKRGDELERSLVERLGNHHHVGDIRGRGLFRGVELVADRATKQVFDPEKKINAKVKREAMARGLMVYPLGGTVDGQRGRAEEHTSELQSLMRTSYAVCCLKKTNNDT